MSNVTINSLPTAGSIDPVTDILPIYTANVLATQGINRNTYLGLASAPVGLTDSQTITNKILGNTNTVTLKDTLFTLQDDGDITKQARFQLSSITTGNTRTYTLPDVTDTLVALTATQTLANKTLTSPTVNSPTITNATITSDNYAGFTVSNSGTIYGISVALGVITSAGSVGSGANATNGVQAAALATNAITLGYTQITSNYVGAGDTSVHQVTGLTSTVTIPAGGRKVKITFFAKDIFAATAGAITTWSIWDGTVGSGTQLAATGTNAQANGYAFPGICIAVVTPAAGSKTYNIGAQTSNAANVPTLEASSTAPAFILVEAI